MESAPNLTKENILASYDECRSRAVQYFCEPTDFLKRFMLGGKAYDINLMDLSLVYSHDGLKAVETIRSVFRDVYEERCIVHGFTKDLYEYSSFTFFLKHFGIHPFKKSDKPDFFISIDGKTVDIEVRSVFTGEDAIWNKIGSLLFGEQLTRPETVGLFERKASVAGRTVKVSFENGANEAFTAGSNAARADTAARADAAPSAEPLYNCGEYKNMILSSILRKDEQVSKFNDGNPKWLLLDTNNSPCFYSPRTIAEVRERIDSMNDLIHSIEEIFIINQAAGVCFRYSVN